MHYSMLLHVSPTTVTFKWINQYKYRNPTITSMTVLFRPNQVMFDNVDSTNVVTNTNGEEMTIPPRYYSIGEISVILNTITDITFSTSTRLRVIGVSESSSHTPSISPMLQIFERSSVWKDERSFYLLRSMDRT